MAPRVDAGESVCGEREDAQLASGGASVRAHGERARHALRDAAEALLLVGEVLRAAMRRVVAPSSLLQLAGERVSVESQRQSEGVGLALQLRYVVGERARRSTGVVHMHVRARRVGRFGAAGRFCAAADGEVASRKTASSTRSSNGRGPCSQPS